MGYDSCPMIGFDSVAVAEIINLPSDHVIGFMIAVGWLGDSLKVRVKAPPEKGRANEAVVALLAERLRIDASSIVVVSGHG
jgi:nitroreductase